ncbi:hypothetical protein EXE58_00930 [Nocardioides seonyuensis]|uniref:NlpC/P60 family protein n=1 Tax=Nocardioides seonyuensis TaxID=2518371 RepID=A0A4P7IAW6_9ACTN|nr:hypothetical protein [Nocardioides seonyuensis]QBX54174.1 hypothetical protein EXE58_00930 [Nocardioides seonyuensis]
MTRTRRLIATAAATAALVAPAAVTASATAAPHEHKDKPAKTDKPAKGTVKSQAKQLLKDVAGKDKRLTRLAESNAVARLADETEAALVANITDAQTALTDVKTAVEAADSTVDTRAVRKELRSFRVVNFRLAVNILKQAENLAEEAATDPEATAALDAAETAALALTATSTKADVKAARAHLELAHTELEEV